MYDFTLRQFQTTLPWTVKYSEDFRSSPVTHKDFAHAMHHVSKAAGKLHGLCDDMDHDKDIAAGMNTAYSSMRESATKYLADLVVCALRAANTLPGGPIDLQSAVHQRIEEKNGVKLQMFFACGGYVGEGFIHQPIDRAGETVLPVRKGKHVELHEFVEKFKGSLLVPADKLSPSEISNAAIQGRVYCSLAGAPFFIAMPNGWRITKDVDK